MTIDILPGADKGELPCQNVSNPDLFFSRDPADQAEAVRICNTCPVSKLCQVGANQRHEIRGTWGGQVRGGTAVEHKPETRACAREGCTAAEFEVNKLTPNRRFCSRACQERARRDAAAAKATETRTCASPDCGATFTPKTHNGRYCSNTCMYREAKRRERSRQKGTN